MLSIEKDSTAEEIFIHGTPEALREFAKKLWAVAEKGEAKGKHKEHLTTKSSSDPELSTKLQGDPSKYSVVKKSSICSRVS